MSITPNARQRMENLRSRMLANGGRLGVGSELVGAADTSLETLRVFSPLAAPLRPPNYSVGDKDRHADTESNKDNVDNAGAISPSIRLCNAPFSGLTTDQLYALLKLRSEVFVVEQVSH
jgi:hypothetical protein